jgi:hypothetical protein
MEERLPEIFLAWQDCLPAMVCLPVSILRLWCIDRCCVVRMFDEWCRDDPLIGLPVCYNAPAPTRAFDMATRPCPV